MKTCFFIFTSKFERKIRIKEERYFLEKDLCNKRKQQDLRHLGAFTMKTVFLVYIPKHIFVPLPNFFALP